MDTTIPAIYEQGAFHPLEPLELPESTMVEVHLLAKDHGSKGRQRLFNSTLFYYVLLCHSLQNGQRKFRPANFYKNFPRRIYKRFGYLCPISHRDLCAMLLSRSKGFEGKAIGDRAAALQFLSSIN